MGLRILNRDIIYGVNKIMACGKEFKIIGGVWKKGIEPSEFTATCVDDEFVTRLCPDCSQVTSKESEDKE